MGNRKQPFGYQIMDGQVATCPPEADLVCRVFADYLAGLSFKSLAEKLDQQPVHYDGDKPWNKNMIARMLEDSRYTGDRGWPVIIDEETYTAAQEKRQAGQGNSRQCGADKAVRQIIGQAAPHKMTLKAWELILQLILDPTQVRVPKSQPSAESERIRKELDEAFLTLPVDEDMVNALLRQSASATYQAIDPNEYETLRLQRIFHAADPCQQLNAELIHDTVSEIIVDAGTVKLRLKNQQIFEGVIIHE